MIINKYNLNKLVFTSASLSLCGMFYIILNWELNVLQYTGFFFFIVLCLHYNLNVLHQASHRLLSKNKYINDFFGNLSAILGGVTFPAFQATHFIHHKNPSDRNEDPDFAITNSKSFFLLPFKIWYHDKYYWQKGLWRKHFTAWQYFLDRFAQICIVLGFQLTDNISTWIYFWLIPTYIVGFLNGMFLFYFPHYSTKVENIWRSQKHKTYLHPIINTFKKLSLIFIDISRYYHEKHHEKIQENQNFYPMEIYLYDKFVINKPVSLKYNGKYLNIYGSIKPN